MMIKTLRATANKKKTQRGEQDYTRISALAERKKEVNNEIK